MRVIAIFLLFCYYIYGYKLSDNIGFVVDKYKSFNTLKYRIYEYEDGSIGPSCCNGYLCVQAAGAMAVSIRVGRKISLKSVEEYFKTFRKAGYYPSMQDWINASNHYHIKDLNVKINHVRDIKDLYQKVKNAIDNNYPVSILLTDFDAFFNQWDIYNLFSYENRFLINLLNYFPFINLTELLSKELLFKIYSFLNMYDFKVPVVSSITGGVNHSVLIVGYIKDNDTVYYAIRDPYIKKCPNNSNGFCFLFDYLIDEDTLNNYLIEGNTLLIFKTNPNSKLMDSNKNGFF